MPAAYFHQIVAQRAFRATGREEGNLNLLYWGAQGPDILFYYGRLKRRGERTKPIQHAGSLIHRQNTSRFFANLLRQAHKGETGTQLYVLGFLAHYATDQVLHPYVYAHSVDALGRIRNTPHNMLESKLDTWLWQRDGQTGAPHQCNYDVLEEELTHIAKLLADVYSKSYSGEELAPSQVLDAFHDARAVCERLYCKNRFHLFLLRLLELLQFKPLSITCHVAKPYPVRDNDPVLNVEGNSWYSPFEPQRKRNASVPQLLVDATQKAIYYMNLANDYWNGELLLTDVVAELGDKSYLSGLDWRQTPDPGKVQVAGSTWAKDMKLMKK